MTYTPSYTPGEMIEVRDSVYEQWVERKYLFAFERWVFCESFEGAESAPKAWVIHKPIPKPKRIPLGPEDFKPGDAITNGVGTGWGIIQAIGPEHVLIANGHISFKELMDQNYEFHDGRPCWKEAGS